MGLQIGRRGRLYVKLEGTYADTTVTFAATDALRHIDVGFSYDPFGKVTSPEKKSSPGPVARHTRRAAAGLDLRAALLRPSGTLNTVPEISPVLEAAFGAKTNVTLSTTFKPNPVAVALAGAGAGNVDDGTHEYYVAFVDGTGTTKCSALASVTVVDKASNGKVSVTSIPLGPTGTTSRKLFRTEAGQTGVANAKLLTELANNSATTYEDNTADSGLGAAAPTTDTSALLTTTSGFVADAGALAKGDAILISRNSVKYVRFLTAVSTTNLTWSPALPSAVVADEAVKGCITYKLTTELAKSLALLHCLPDMRRCLLGAGVDKFAIKIDANDEPRVTASGPAQKLHASAPSDPATFTTVGGNPPSGIIGETRIGSGAYVIKSMEIALTNGIKARNHECDNGGEATEIYRADRREITMNLDAFAETAATVYDQAIAGTELAVLKQVGRTEGNIVAVFAPRVEFKVPAQDDPDAEVSWPFTGVCLETADGENDELRLAIA